MSQQGPAKVDAPSPEQQAGHPADLVDDCLFCNIIRKRIPARIVHEDDDLIVFHDIRPLTPVHLLVVPKVHVQNFFDADGQHSALFGRMFTRLGSIARANGMEGGFRSIINSGTVARQEVYHLHVHLLGGGEPLPGGLMDHG